MSNAVTELQPCPFCGRNASIEQYGDRGQSTIYQCDNCSCRLETGEEWSHGQEWNRRALSAHPSPVGLNVDALAQEIRRVDGRNDKGAGALAEALMPFIRSALESSAPIKGETERNRFSSPLAEATRKKVHNELAHLRASVLRSAGDAHDEAAVKSEWPHLIQLCRTLGLFASVIKSGEPWTAACQTEYELANTAAKEIYSELNGIAPVKGETEGWRPIANLPILQKVLVWGALGILIYTAKDEYWREDWEFSEDEPTHWRFLPASPEQGREK